MTVYPELSSPDDIAFTDISNAIAAFVAYEWRSDSAPFDAVLKGTLQLEDTAQKGMALFYGEAKCASCHTGAFLTDHRFHVMAAPQIGPGKSPTFQDHHRDDGRFRVTGLEADRYAFRTPSLRNVALTAPYGHAGAHSDLAKFIESHADPAQSLRAYDRIQARLPPYNADDFVVIDDPKQIDAIANAVSVQPISLDADDITALTAFLDTLSDPASVAGRLGVPKTVVL